MRRSGVALCLKCETLRRKARLAFGQNNPGEMGPYHCRLVLVGYEAGAEVPEPGLVVLGAVAVAQRPVREADHTNLQ